jgi:hypothetical protein
MTETRIIEAEEPPEPSPCYYFEPAYTFIEEDAPPLAKTVVSESYSDGTISEKGHTVEMGWSHCRGLA